MRFITGSVCIFIFTGLIVLSVMPVAMCAEDAPKVSPRTTEAMQTPEFWIDRLDNPDRVFLTPEQITELNAKNQAGTLETTDVFGNPYSIKGIVDSKDVIGVQYKFEKPLSITSFPADSLRARFERVRDYFDNGDYYDRVQKKYTREMKDELYEKADFDGVSSVIRPRYGILVAHTLQRVLPTQFPAWRSPDGWLDMLQATAADFGTPVVILHESKEKDWYYVRSEVAFGWVPASHVAIGDPSEIRRIAYAENFIVATVHKVPVYADRGFNTFITDLYMGARLELAEKNTEGYKVTVPYRDIDGTMQTTAGWVKPDAGVHVGYQEFTQRTILNTMFSLLYRPYGWADESNERDCCGTLRVVYKTFGINMPRWTTHQLHSANHVMAFPKDTPDEKKYELLDTTEPAVTLVGFAWHICMYLGKVDGRYYVIHQTGYSYNTDDGTEMKVRRVNVNDTELEGGSYIGNWTEISEFKP